MLGVQVQGWPDGWPDGYWDLSWSVATIIGFNSTENKYLVEYETVTALFLSVLLILAPQSKVYGLLQVLQEH